MAKKLLIFIASDPKGSSRPREALRMAAGLAPWKGVEITVCFWGACAEWLAESEDDPDFEDHWKQGITALKGAGAKIVGEKGRRAGVGQECTEKQMQEILRKSHYSMEF